MNWKKAFHPFAPISAYDVECIARAIESAGLQVGFDRCRRILSVRDSHIDLLASFIPAFDDPARFLPKHLVGVLDCEYGESPQGENLMF